MDEDTCEVEETCSVEDSQSGSSSKFKVCAGCMKSGSSHEKCYSKYCKICMHFFKSRTALREHFTEYHADEYCKACDKLVIWVSVHKCP